MHLKAKLETVDEDGPSESSTDTDTIDKNQFTFTPSNNSKSVTSPTNPSNDLLSIKP